MLKKVLLMAGLVILLAASLSGAGCGSGNALADMVAKVPGDTASLKYVDVAALRNDDDLAELYDSWKATIDARLESHGIISADVNVFALGVSTGMRFTLLDGNFDLDQVRGKLEALSFDKGEYKGVELWEAGGGYDSDPRVALMDGLIILGNEAGVEGCIKVMKEGDTSWLKKVDIREVVDRIPVGLYVDLEKNALTGLIVKGFESYGLSAQKEDSDTLDIAGVAKFEDEDDADDGDAAIETMLETIFQNVDVTQKESFLIAVAELDIDSAGFFFNGL